MMEKAASAGDGSEAVGDEASDDVETAAGVDPYDIIDPVDILSKLPKDFYEKIVRFDYILPFRKYSIEFEYLIE